MKLLSVLLAALLHAAPAAQAQGLGLDYAYTTAPLINFSHIAAVNNNLMNTALREEQKPIRIGARPAVQRNAQELAKVFPPAQQDKMAQVFQQSMEVYQQVAAKMGWQRDDLDGALAAFIVGNYMVFANREVADADFAAVAQQLRQGGGTRRLAEKHSAQALRNLYEKSAMVGAFMAVAYKSQQQQPQPEHVAANLRNSARENLKLVLGTEPQRLRIDAKGLQVQ